METLAVSYRVRYPVQPWCMWAMSRGRYANHTNATRSSKQHLLSSMIHFFSKKCRLMVVMRMTWGTTIMYKSSKSKTNESHARYIKTETTFNRVTHDTKNTENTVFFSIFRPLPLPITRALARYFRIPQRMGLACGLCVGCTITNVTTLLKRFCSALEKQWPSRRKAEKSQVFVIFSDIRMRAKNCFQGDLEHVCKRDVCRVLRAKECPVSSILLCQFPVWYGLKSRGFGFLAWSCARKRNIWVFGDEDVVLWSFRRRAPS